MFFWIPLCDLKIFLEDFILLVLLISSGGCDIWNRGAIIGMLYMLGPFSGSMASIILNSNGLLSDEFIENKKILQ